MDRRMPADHLLSPMYALYMGLHEYEFFGWERIEIKTAEHMIYIIYKSDRLIFFGFDRED